MSSSKIIGSKLSDIFIFDESNKDIISRCYRSEAPILVRDCSLQLIKNDKQICHLTVFPSGAHVGLSIWPSSSRSISAHTGASICFWFRLLNSA